MPIGVGSLTLLLAVCSCASFSTSALGETGDASADAGGSEGGGGVVAPPGCDLTKGPKDSPSCVVDAVGVFVSPTGDDGAAGTKGAPLKTIAKGVDLAATKGLPRVYVCEGTYDSNVEIKTPLSVYGGLTCAWAATEAKPKLAPTKGTALRVTKVTGAVVVEDFDVLGSADANTPGDSAIAAFASESNNVAFRRVNLTAGAGTGGAKGVSASNYTAPAKDGVAALNGAAAVTCACLDGTTQSIGGKGGPVGAGGDPGSASPDVGGINSGNGGATCSVGTIGANGVANAKGQGSAVPGALGADGWKSTIDGTSGKNGNPGQGGGGGGGRTAVGVGGGGACGGCGGAGGKPGGVGGSSFALLSFQSSVVVEGGVLQSASGGGGGMGGDGQGGQSGGVAGPGACDGGPGGNGAGGSGGGGGAGGHSAPVAFVGTAPKVTGATVTPGAKGAVGPGGAPGAGSGNPGTAGDPGAEGKAQAALVL